MKTVIFASVHDTGRSQMAAAFFNRMAHPELARAFAAGLRPADRIQPEVVETMRESGIDLSGATPTLFTPELARDAHILITIGCHEECTVTSAVRREDWTLPDPMGQPIGRVREIRDAVRARVWKVIAKEGWWKLQPVQRSRQLRVG